MEKLLSIWTRFKVVILLLLIFVIGFAIGYFCHKPKVVEIPKEVIVTKEVPKVKTITNTQTQFKYIPKLSPNDSDVEATINKPVVSVSVNGKKHNFDLVQGETQKFENGKVVMDQTSTITFDVKVPDRNELRLSAEMEVNKDKISPAVSVEKQNGRLHYGAKYDIKDKETSAFVKYDVLKFYTEK